MEKMMGEITAAGNQIVMKLMKIQKELEREAFPTLHGHSLLSTYINDLMKNQSKPTSAPENGP